MCFLGYCFHGSLEPLGKRECGEGGEDFEPEDVELNEGNEDVEERETDEEGSQEDDEEGMTGDTEWTPSMGTRREKGHGPPW